MSTIWVRQGWPRGLLVKWRFFNTREVCLTGWRQRIMDKSRAEIGIELSRLIARQTEFFRKGDPTPAEVQEFERADERIRQLFADLEQLNKAA